ncbi:MAG: hypothetical protein ACI8TX_001537 [Hyphomicrobiaceae bacterium]
MNRGFSATLAAALATIGVAAATTCGAPTSAMRPTLEPPPSNQSIVARIGKQPVPFEALNGASQGAIAAAYTELDRELARATVEGCVRLAQDQTARSLGMSRKGWLERLWENARPTEAEIDAFQIANVKAFQDSTPAPELIAHLLTLRQYRTSLAEAVPTFEISESDLYRRALYAPHERLALCANNSVTAARALAWAGPSLVRKQALANESVCTALNGAAGDKLLLEFQARRQSTDVASVVAEAEANAPEPSFDEIHEMAENRLGALNDANWAEGTERLMARNRERERLALFERLRVDFAPQCLMTAPEPRTATTRANTLVYYGAVGCPLCTPGYALLARLHKRLASDGLTLRWSHNFDPAFAPQFVDAVAIDCAREQRRMWNYLDARMGRALNRESAAADAGLDTDSFAACRAHPARAIAVLEEIHRAGRLGFKGAVPSWKIDQTPHRGWQGEEVLTAALGRSMPTANGQPTTLNPKP